MQKNGGYGLEHAYTNNLTSAKIFYFLLQIAHMIAQLLDCGSLLRNLIPAGFGSAKNLAFRLLEAWRNARNLAVCTAERSSLRLAHRGDHQDCGFRAMLSIGIESGESLGCVPRGRGRDNALP